MTKAFAHFFSSSPITEPSATAMELVCSADSLVTLRAAVDSGADWIHLDYREHDGISNLNDLNFDNAAIVKGIRYAHDERRKVLLALHASAQPGTWAKSRDILERAVQCGIDAIELSDPALMLYAAAHHPELRLHYRVSDSTLNGEAIDYFHKQFGVSQVVLPKVLSLAQIVRIAEKTSVELQVISFGKFCTIIGGGNVAASGTAPSNRNMHVWSGTGVLSVDYCATGENAVNDSSFAFDRLPDANALKLLPQLAAIGVRAIKVETQELGPIHLAHLARVWRTAIDDCLEDLGHYCVKPSWIAELNKIAKERC